MTQVSPSSDSAFARVWALTRLVEEVNACALPGCTIKIDSFLPVMWRAVLRGFVKHEHAVFVANGLRWGFDAGVQRGRLKGKRVWRNYKSAVDAMDRVARATQKRVDGGKTLCLGDWVDLRGSLYDEISDFYCFPLGAVAKPLEPTEVRPASDHTKTGLNAATVLGILRHAITAAKDVAWMLKTGYFMYVSDVEAAFPMLPLAPWLWWFMLHRVVLPSNRGRDTLCMHTFGDFGTRGMPGTFYIFYVKVVVQMARSEMIISLPLAVYVDDNALIGPFEHQTNAQMRSFQEWAERVAGVSSKVLKDRRAAQRNLYVGFWWDSLARTRTLEEQKLASYVRELLDFSTRRVATLHELRSLAGKAQRAVMTFPPGAACLLTNFFLLMAGLMLPWQSRRTTASSRFDARFVAELLRLNLGRGYFSYDQFQWGLGVRSDACKSSGYVAADQSKVPAFAGAGYVSQCGRYRFWRYGRAASRQLIDVLEGDAVVLAVEDLCDSWRRQMIPFGIDNMAFQRSEARGRSRATRLNDLLKTLFVLQIRYDFVLSSYWLASEANGLADDLSRDRESAFLASVFSSGFLAPGASLRRHPESGAVRTFEADRPDAMHVLRSLLAEYPTTTLRDGALRLRGAGGAWRGLSSFASTVPRGRATLTQGLPAHLLGRVEALLDNRLSASSWRTIQTGLKHWRDVADTHMWDVLIEADDPERGAKLVALVLHLLDDTDLVWSSIASYVWGVRNWQQLQHQPDPVLGVDGWDKFTQACAVVAHVPAEPRAQIPLEVIKAILDDQDSSDFEDCQFAFFILTLLFTFSRSECPCPKNFTGDDSWDDDKHWQVRDIQMEVDGPNRSKYFKVNFKSIKQDARNERSTAVRDGDRVVDWSYVGDVPDTVFSMVTWYLALIRLHGCARVKTDPFFLSRCRAKPYTYKAAMADLKTRLARVGVTEKYGLHSFRVAGYNLSKHANGTELTVAHGLWQSEGHERYERFPLTARLAIPANMVGVLASGATVQERVVVRTPLARGRGRNAGTSPVRGSAVMEEAVERPSLPDGYVEVVSPGRPPSYRSPGGHIYYSRLQCWQAFDLERASSRGGSSVIFASDGSASPGSWMSPRPHSAVRAVARRARVAPAPAPQPPVGSAAAAEVLADIIVEHERPSTRRAPVERQRG